MRHTVGKLSTRATTLFQTAPRSEVCSQSYGVPKFWESRLARFRDSHAGVLGEKNHMDVGPVERSRVYYKGEGGGFPQVRAMVSLVCPCCPWLVLAPKVLQLYTNHLVWVVCRPVWVGEACQLFLVPSQSSNTPFYPSKCCELQSVPRFLPHFRCFSLGFTFESLKELGVRHHNKLSIFMFFFNGAIIQKLVKDRRLVMNNVCLLSFWMHWILIIIARKCFNFRHWNFAFSMLNMFQQSIQLWNDECFSHSHMGANLTLNLMH